ncbi:AAA family ATPase [Thalassoroseus pseudoceratinae]|uniref:AAA family ATPase n=1 Tax=Thalassoroseus pseudoceratinae TaxID=2713176 RepID=UPI0014236C7B|nr:AAA family ATPase [Thalassoroseus pseudoceratinae]
MNFHEQEQTPTELREVRPSSFSHVIGQDHVKQALQIAVDAHFHEGASKPLEDILLCGPPGLGKTALVSVLADELGCDSNFTEVLAQSITNTAELNSALLGVSKGILFLDEIHLLNSAHQTALLRILERRCIEISNGKTVTSLPLAPFCLVGATTNPEGLVAPLVDRFRLVLHLDFYDEIQLAKIVQQRCHALRWEYDPELLPEIAKCARQTPRIAIRLLGAARRVAVAQGANRVEVGHLLYACRIERISSRGLDNFQQKYLRLLGTSSQRLNVLASMLGVTSAKVVTATIEPFLLRSAFVVKTDNGLRQLSQAGRDHLAEIEALNE